MKNLNILTALLFATSLYAECVHYPSLSLGGLPNDSITVENALAHSTYTVTSVQNGELGKLKETRLKNLFDHQILHYRIDWYDSEGKMIATATLQAFKGYPYELKMFRPKIIKTKQYGGKNIAPYYHEITTEKKILGPYYEMRREDAFRIYISDCEGNELAFITGSKSYKFWSIIGWKQKTALRIFNRADEVTSGNNRPFIGIDKKPNKRGGVIVSDLRSGGHAANISSDISFPKKRTVSIPGTPEDSVDVKILVMLSAIDMYFDLDFSQSRTDIILMSEF